MLYIVSTPIGNLKDITLRALEVLKSVDLIAAEDTRHTKILLDTYQIQKPMTSFFEHNQSSKIDYLVGLLREGKDIALLSDAGTPGISDPGYPLIERVRREGLPMTVIPGVAALIAALTLSGLPAHSFVFEGFLPVKSQARRKKLEELKQLNRTAIYYESPHRVLKTLKDIDEVLGDVTVVCARELTKKFEEVHRGTGRELFDQFTHSKPRGEFVILVSPKQ